MLIFKGYRFTFILISLQFLMMRVFVRFFGSFRRIMFFICQLYFIYFILFLGFWIL
ncbi:unnamed protein product [Angiostrongylus costaricensis]|uniref:Uncharacterized protein n=1 Tax=Angiostrongylus costaricensis TaxID=334426 RepID=A0A0R3PUT7_ANGCS|nr:unnamed protein product [Angiostrongylus costaricensis]